MNEQPTQKPAVYSAISHASAQIAKTGIAKDRYNEQQRFKYRSVDDIMNVINAALHDNGLVIFPTVLTRDVVERPTKSGGVMFTVTVSVKFEIVSTDDGTMHSCVMFGEAQDSGDKATNKAMSAAYKYMALQVFCIPTEGDNDADAKIPPPAAQKTPYTLEMAKGNIESWVNLKIDVNRLFANIRTKHILAEDVELFIKDALQPGG